MTGQVLPFKTRSGTEPLMTKRQLAAALNFSERWIELRQRDGLPSVMIGRRRRYLFSEVMAWLRSREEA